MKIPIILAHTVDKVLTIRGSFNLRLLMLFGFTETRSHLVEVMNQSSLDLSHFDACAKSL